MDSQAFESGNLFKVIQKGERYISKAFQKAIVLVGLSRQGKSAVFNWILQKSMKGVGEDIPSYELINENEPGSAKMGNYYSSETLIPTVCPEIREGLGVTLIDTAGYKDTRNYVGVLGVSYFLNCIFEKVRKVKFVLTIEEAALRAGRPDDMVNTFIGFLEMFKVELMSPAQKQKLMDSMAMVITKCQQSPRHNTFFNTFIRRCQDERLNIPRKAQILELFQNMVRSNRIEDFKQAVHGQNPEKCTFLDRFTDWNYFDLDEAEAEAGSNIIDLGFQKKYEVMSQKDKKAFKEQIQNKDKCMKDFAFIMAAFQQSFIEGLRSMISQRNLQKKISLEWLHMKKMFSQINRFLDKNDVYETQKRVGPKVQVSYSLPTFVFAVKSILRAHSSIDQIAQNEPGSSFGQEMDRLSSIFSGLVDNMKPFCSNSQEEVLIMRLKQVLINVFNQFKGLYKIKSELVHTFTFTLKDVCFNVFEHKQTEFLKMIIAEFDTSLLADMFPTLLLLEEYEELFFQYESKCLNENENSQSVITNQRLILEMAKTNLLASLGKKREAFLTCSKAIKSVLDISSIVAGSNLDDEIKQARAQQLYMQRLDLIKQAVQLLKEQKKTENYNPLNYCLQICEKYQLFSYVCEVYDLLIKSSSSNNVELCQIYEAYSIYCQKWGHFERALQLLRKKRDTEKNYQNMNQTRFLIKQLLQNRQKILSEAANLQISWKRQPEKDQDLIQILDQIETLMKEDPAQNTTQLSH